MKAQGLILLYVLAVGITGSHTPMLGQTVRRAGIGPVAGASRPAGVPAGYVITPFGYFHPSCVERLAKGEKLLADGRVQHADGTVEAVAPVCTYPRYTPSGLPVTPGAGLSAEINGWIENANITTGSPDKSFGSLIGVWIVPPEPRHKGDQVLFFFPGFEDINDAQTSILQPTLEWWAPTNWTIASWNCCISGITIASPGVNVRPGDLIYGSITSTCPAGTLSCPTWNVLAVDLSSGDSTTLEDTPSEGQIFNWAFGGTLEAYSVGSCADFPDDDGISFDFVTVFDERLNPVKHPKWTVTSTFPTSPACNYGVKADWHEIRLNY